MLIVLIKFKCLLQKIQLFFQDPKTHVFQQLHTSLNVKSNSNVSLQCFTSLLLTNKSKNIN